MYGDLNAQLYLTVGCGDNVNNFTLSPKKDLGASYGVSNVVYNNSDYIDTSNAGATNFITYFQCYANNSGYITFEELYFDI